MRKPRILMAMARDALLPSFFSELNKTTLVLINSTLLTGCVAAFMSFFMDVTQLAGMVSVGTLLTFTIVAVSILILRYVPPDGVPVSPSLQQSADVETLPQSAQGSYSENVSLGNPLVLKDMHDNGVTRKLEEQKRRKGAASSISATCMSYTSNSCSIC